MRFIMRFVYFRVLKKVCSMFEHCKDCPFGATSEENKCMLMYCAPENYQLTNGEGPWKALQ